MFNKKAIADLRERVGDNYCSQQADYRFMLEQFNLLLKTLKLERKYTPSVDEKVEFVPIPVSNSGERV